MRGLVWVVLMCCAAWPLLAGCDDAATAPTQAPEPTLSSPSPVSVVVRTATPKPKASKTPKAKATKKPKKHKSAWGVRFYHHHSNDGAKYTDRRSPVFVTGSGRIKVVWDVWPTQDDYDWAAVFFRTGTNPDNSNGVGKWLMSMSGTPDSGSKEMRLPAGKACYLWTEFLHADGDFTILEHR